MQAIHMTNHKGMQSANNILIQDNEGNLYLQSYNEIVAVRKEGRVYIKKSGLNRSATTNRYIEYFKDKYGDGVVLEDEVFKAVE